MHDIYYIHTFDVYLLHVSVPVHHHQAEATMPVTWKTNYSDAIFIYGFSFVVCMSSSSSSSYIFHGVGPLDDDPFRSHVSISLFEGLPWFLLPVGEKCFFPWDLPVVKIPPEWVTGPEQGKSSGRVATFSHRTGLFRDGISSIPGETVIPLWLGRHFLVCENRVYHEKVRMTVG